MSRIDDVFKRITGAVADPRPASALDRYASEPRVEENRVTTFVAAGPHAVEAKSQVRQKQPAPPEPAVPAATPAPVQHTHIHQAHQSEPVSDEEAVASQQLIDFQQVFNYAGFLARSIRRRKFLTLGTFSFAFALTVAGGLLMPKTYHVGTKLLAQRNAVMAALSNPGRAVPWDADAPTRSAAETVLRRDNLLELMKKTDLMNEWERTRAPILKLKDWLMKVATRYDPTPEEKQDAMLGLLENKMTVVAGPVGDGTVSIDLDWRDPEMGYRLVEEAQQAFLDAREKAETEAITSSIEILENYSKSLHQKIDATLNELERTQKSRGGGPGAGSAVIAQAARPHSSPAGPVSVGASSLTSLGLPVLDGSVELNSRINDLNNVIASKRLELARFEGDHQRQISEQQANLNRLKTTYQPAHPTVQSAEQQLAALSHPDPQVVALRNELLDLEKEQGKLTAAAADLLIKAELAKRTAAAAAPWTSAAPSTTPTGNVLAPPAMPAQSQVSSQVAEFATLQLRTELSSYQSVLERTDSAKIELAVAQSAFKTGNRYKVVRPAQVPRDPIKPNLKLILAGGFFGSLMLALVAAVGSDLLGNRILETWQIERQLGLPVLGSLETV